MSDTVEHSSPPPGNGRESIRVLVVDDSPMNMTLLRSYLKGPEYIVETAVNGAIAVEKFQAGHFDIVLMDMQMPVMDGYTATQAIRAWEAEQKKRRTPILALTAHAYAEQRRQSLDAGCDAHLVKPMLKPALLEAIQSFTGKRQKILVKVPPGIEEGVPLFLELAREDVRNLEAALRKADYDRIRFIGHDLKGSGGGYGFDGITEIGKSIEDAAKRADGNEARHHIAALAEYLSRVEVV